MTKLKKFWAASALISLAVMAFAGYSIYERMSLHFSGDTIEVRPVPVPLPQEEEEDAPEKEPAAVKEDKKAKEDKKVKEDKKTIEAKKDKEEEIKAGKVAAASAKTENDKTRAVKITFEYKDNSARSVMIAGSFTSWKDKKMTKKDGVWKTDVYILPGTYPYHFTVDGKKKLDPGKPKAPTGDSLVDVN